jgi:hypothetical protein
MMPPKFNSGPALPFSKTVLDDGAMTLVTEVFGTPHWDQQAGRRTRSRVLESDDDIDGGSTQSEVLFSQDGELPAAAVPLGTERRQSYVRHTISRNNSDVLVTIGGGDALLHKNGQSVDVDDELWARLEVDQSIPDVVAHATELLRKADRRRTFELELLNLATYESICAPLVKLAKEITAYEKKKKRMASFNEAAADRQVLVAILYMLGHQNRKFSALRQPMAQLLSLRGAGGNVHDAVQALSMAHSQRHVRGTRSKAGSDFHEHLKNLELLGPLGGGWAAQDSVEDATEPCVFVLGVDDFHKIYAHRTPTANSSSDALHFASALLRRVPSAAAPPVMSANGVSVWNPLVLEGWRVRSEMHQSDGWFGSSFLAGVSAEELTRITQAGGQFEQLCDVLHYNGAGEAGGGRGVTRDMKHHVRLLQLIETGLHNTAEYREVFRKLLDVAPMLEHYVTLGKCLLLSGDYPSQYHPRWIVYHRLAQVKSKGTIPEDEREVKLAKVCSVCVCVPPPLLYANNKVSSPSV